MIVQRKIIFSARNGPESSDLASPVQTKVVNKSIRNLHHVLMKIEQVITLLKHISLRVLGD